MPFTMNVKVEYQFCPKWPKFSKQPNDEIYITGLTCIQCQSELNFSLTYFYFLQKVDH